MLGAARKAEEGPMARFTCEGAGTRGTRARRAGARRAEAPGALAFFLGGKYEKPGFLKSILAARSGNKRRVI